MRRAGSTMAALGGELQALLHAEAMLLIDDRERQVLEAHLALEQRMRADAEPRLTAGNSAERRALRAGTLRAGQQAHNDAERFEPGRQRARMLLGEQLRRRHEGGLGAA